MKKTLFNAFLGLTFSLYFVCGCATEKRLKKIETRAGELLDVAHKSEFGREGKGNLDLDAHRVFGAVSATAIELDLREALELAAKHSRSYQDSREALYRAALDLVGVAHDWEMTFGAVLKGQAAYNGEDNKTTLSGSDLLALSGRRRFFNGATLTGGLAVDTLRVLSGGESVQISSLANVTLSQPLLGGADKLVIREPLTAAENALIYQLRSFARNRKSLLISVAEKYYAVLSAIDSLEIAQKNFENLRDSRERSEAMAEAGRVPPFQVDQARQKELSADATLVSRRESLQSAKDSLKTILGLPLEAKVALDRKDLERLAEAGLPRPDLSLEEAILFAREHRLDYATVRDQLADAKRYVKIRKDALRVKVNLLLGASASSPTDHKLRNIDWKDGSAYVGLDGDLGLDKTDELIAYRKALISEARAQRQLEAEADSIASDLRSVWRQLESSRQSYEIQRISVQLSEKRVESTELLFQAGRVNIRELLDARDSLTSAQNSLTSALVNHRMNWLKLQYQLERLPTDPATLWSPALATKTTVPTP